MSGFIITAGCFFLCLILKSVWKAFIIGLVIYIFGSFAYEISSIPSGAQTNITFDNFLYFAAGASGKFSVCFLIGWLVYSLFNSPKRKSNSNDKEQS